MPSRNHFPSKLGVWPLFILFPTPAYQFIRFLPLQLNLPIFESSILQTPAFLDSSLYFGGLIMERVIKEMDNLDLLFFVL